MLVEGRDSLRNVKAVLALAGNRRAALTDAQLLRRVVAVLCYAISAMTLPGFPESIISTYNTDTTVHRKTAPRQSRKLAPTIARLSFASATANC